MEFERKYLWILGTGIAFGTMEIALKIAGNSFTAMQLTFLRFFIGGLILLPFALKDWKRRDFWPSRGDLGFLALLGILNICFSMTMFQLGVMRTNANLAAVIMSINPIFTAVFAHFIVNDRFTRKKAIILGLSIIGLIIVANPFDLGENNQVLGIAFMLLASLSFGLYTALGKLRIQKIGGMGLNSFSFLIGSSTQLILILLMDEPIIAGINLDTLGVLLYVSVIVTGFGYFCLMKAVESCGPAVASYAFFVKPVIAVGLAAIILKEPLTWNIALGVIIIVGSFLSQVKPRKRKAVEVD